MPGSPLTTSTRLRPARTSASSPSRASHCCLRPHNITRRPPGGSPAIVELAPRPATLAGPARRREPHGQDAGVLRQVPCATVVITRRGPLARGRAQRIHPLRRPPPPPPVPTPT